jgi:hypothetical protein
MGMKHLPRIRARAAAIVALLVSLAVTTAGCAMVAGQGSRVVVQAVARGVTTAAPFFDETLQLGIDAAVGEALALGGGTKKGNQPGLYGGSRNKTACAKDKLIRFLKDPANRQKAQEWAAVQGLRGVGEIAGFVRKLTPVVLRNDTLVKNHDYKKGKAEAFDALLEAGIAVLVDRYGKPVVKCSCGNPLGAFEHDADSVDPKFEDRSKGKKWKGYDPKKTVKVEPVAEEPPVVKYELVDIDKADTGLERLAGTDGEQDEPLPEDPYTGSNPDTTDVDTTVPAVTGLPTAEATQILEDQGFQVQLTDGPPGSADPGTVLAQDPAAGSPAAQGTTVTLTVAPDPGMAEQGLFPETPAAPEPTVTSDPLDDPGTVPEGVGD